MNPLKLPHSLNKNNAFHYPPPTIFFSDFYHSLKIGTEKKIQHMITFFKCSSSFNIVFRTGRFHTGLTQLVWRKNHYKIFMIRTRTSGEMAEKIYDKYVRSKVVRNYAELN